MDTYKPIIIIAAARSGTNMLRDILVQLPGFGTWPCDEINYIWRHGNVRQPTDEFSPQLARPEVKVYIRRAFRRLADQKDLTHVVEKTCANSLRVPFVNAVFPDAKFIHIIRDGRDVAASASKRWMRSVDLRYVLRKARFVPPTDVPYYALRYCWSRVYKRLSRQQRLAFWGPRFEGMDEVLKRYPLEAACALQWKQCVEEAEEGLRLLDSARVFRLRYEDFVTQPVPVLSDLLSFLETPQPHDCLVAVSRGVRADRIGRVWEDLDRERTSAVERIIHTTLLSYGYA